jgi:hypothetical protein
MHFEVSQKIRLSDTRAGRWIAADALRELTSASAQDSLAKKSKCLARNNQDLI